MSSHQDPHHHLGPSPMYYEMGSGSPVTRQPDPSTESWPPAATTRDQSGPPQPDQPVDLVRNSLEAHDAEDMNYFLGPSYPLPSTSSQDLGVGTDATYINDDTPFYPLVNSSFYPHPPFNYGLAGYTPYDQVYDSSSHLFVHDAPQYPTEGIHIPQTSQGSFPPIHPDLSSQFLSMSRGGPVYQTDTRATGPTPDTPTPDGDNTAAADANAGQHSHPSPVATAPANQSSAPGPSRQPPSSPERKRLLPLTTSDELSTGRRVVPRHDRAQSVHSTSSGSHRRSYSNSDVQGRGPLIPQERYTTSSISLYNAPDQHPIITFNLENPDQIGISIIDILNKTDTFARVRNRTEAFDMGKKTFTLRVQWPGYRPWSKTIAAKDWTKSRAPITRAKLAEAVATAIRDLFEKYRDETYDSDYATWSVGPNGIQLDQICLVALHHVSRGSWQPQLCLLGPRR